MLQETSKISNQIVPQGSHQRSKHESDVHNTTPLAMRSMLQLKLIDLFFKKKSGQNECYWASAARPRCLSSLGDSSAPWP
jgi:hypothetical protein